MKKLLISTCLTALSTVATADSVIVTQTQSWQSVPIVVNTEKHIYTIEKPVPEGNFYYTYSGYRCLREQTNIVGVNAVVLHAGVAGEGDIYCYPE
ncbi:hypothetical protein [Legionella sp. WA2024007413]